MVLGYLYIHVQKNDLRLLIIYKTLLNIHQRYKCKNVTENMFLEEMNFIKTENFCVLIAGNVTERGQASLQPNDKKTSISI